MKVKKSGNLIILEAQKAKAVFPLDLAKYKADDEHSLVLLSKDSEVKASPKSVVIHSPGEYETNDIFIYALSDKPSMVKLFSVDLDGVNVIVFNSSDNIIDLLDTDDISENNVLVCNIDGDLSNVSDIIDELEPNVLVFTGKNEATISEAIKKLSLTPADTQTYYNFSEDDFSDENEKPMQVVLLK